MVSKRAAEKTGTQPIQASPGDPGYLSMKEALVPAALTGSAQLRKDVGTGAERGAHSPGEGDAPAPPLLRKHTNLSIPVLSSSSNLRTIKLVFVLAGLAQ